MGTTFGILGPLECTRDGVPVLLRGGVRRALVLRLLLAPDRPVPVDVLAEDVWEGRSDPRSASTLSSHVSLLRRELGEDRLVGRAHSYRLVVGPGELDARCFEEDAAAGRDALRAGDAADAADRLARALTWWRGPALADVAGQSWAGQEARRLDELRLGTEEGLLEARLALGLHAEVVAEAEAAVAAHPYREQRWGYLMLALYRTGRQTEALRAYQRVRDLLGEEFGLEPSPALTALERAVAAQSPSLEWAPATPAPTAPVVRSVAERWGTVAVLATRSAAGAAALDDHRDAVVPHGGLEVRADDRGLVAVFTAPASALAAARDVQRSAAGPVAVGVAAGPVDLDGGEACGRAVEVAVGLAGRAGDGEILVTEEVVGLAGRRAPGADSEVGTVDLPGLPGGVAVRRLPWEPADPGASVLPLPDELDRSGRSFVGRRRELAALTEAWTRAVGGQRRVVFLAGEPGIGKTTLAAAGAARAAADGGVVLHGRCAEGVGVPFQPFVESLGHYVQFAPRRELAALVEEHGGELGRLVPQLARRVPDLPPATVTDPETERYLVFGAVVGCLRVATAARPVLLVLEDLHWADPSTLQLLRRLVADTARLPLLLVATYRSDEVGETHPLADTLAALWREEGVDRLALEGLSTPEVHDLCVAAAGDRAGPLALALHRDTAGNPFFVGEILRDLVESGRIDRTAGTLPSSLHDVIAQRVRRLGSDVGRLLTVAAVIGVEFDLATVARATGRTNDEVLDAVERAERAALVGERGDGQTFAFHHALIRNALVDRLGPTRRRQVHAAVAAALGRGPAPPAAVLAYHLLAAGDRPAALRAAEEAGADALAALAAADAVTWFTEALTLLPEVEPDARVRRVVLTTQLGVAQQQAGDPAHRSTLLEAGRLAVAAGDGRRAAVAALGNSRGFFSAAGRSDGERLDALRAALDLVDGVDRRLHVRLLAAVCSETVFAAPLADRRALADEARTGARALGDPATVVEVLNLVGESLRHPTCLAERVADAEEALELAEGLSDPAQLFWATGNRMRTLLEAARPVEARVHFERMARTAEEVGHPVFLWLTGFLGALWDFLDGDTAAGLLRAEEAFALGSAVGQPDALNYFATQLSHARWQQGRLGELVDLIAAGASDNPGIPGYRAALARALVQAGRHAEADRELDEAVGGRIDELPEDLLWLYALVNYAEAAVDRDRADVAGILYDRLAPSAGQLVVVGSCEGPVDHYLGELATVLGRTDEAAGHLDRADRLVAATGSPFLAVRVQVARGRLALRRGAAAEARRLLTAAAARATAGGFAGEAARAAALAAGG